MKNKKLANRLKELRKRKGYSQEAAAENSGLSLRTIQRIENGETEPRGDTLKRLANLYEVSPDEILDWTIEEDKGFLMGMNLSALSFLLFPLLGILVPLILWISKKDKIKDVDRTGKELLNFQITWSMLLFLQYAFIIMSVFFRIGFFKSLGFSMKGLIFYHLFLYAFNIVFVVVNSIRIANGKKVSYKPKIQFLK
jgi:uncharacterized Tic20 family protein